MKQTTKSNLMLILAAFIWGSAFVAQSVGMDHLGPFTFNSIRNLIGSLVLLPIIRFMARNTKNHKKEDKKTLLIGGLCCGTILAVASSLQQLGMVYTSAGKAGFITTLYILIVPIMGTFMGKKAGIRVWIGVALALIGMYFLCVTKDFSLSKGDILVMLCAVALSIHILVIDYFSPKVDGIKLSCLQFLVCGILCAIPAVTLEPISIQAIQGATIPLLYTAVFSSGVAYTLQILAQKHTAPTIAALLMSLESVFAVLTAWLILHEHLTPRELFGCLLTFTAIILAQLPTDEPNKDKTGARGKLRDENA